MAEACDWAALGLEPGVKPEPAAADAWPTYRCSAASLAECAARLRGFGYNLLVDLSAVDYPQRPQRFELVLHLRRVPTGEQLRLVVPVAEGQPVPSVSSIWAAANWAEREVYDLFGIRFEDHPDLRRIELPDDWVGHPLRRDYPLRGPRHGQPRPLGQ